MGMIEQFKELIWLFVAGIILMYTFPERQEHLLGRKVKRWDYLPAIILVLPLALWAGFRGNVADTTQYRSNFFAASSNLADIPGILFSEGKDTGFTALTVFMKFFIGDNDTLYFLFFAVLQMACLCYVYRKYSSDYWVSIFLFVASTDYQAWMYNGLRQFVAACLIFSCFDLLVKKKYIRMIIVILLASLLHASALMMIPIIFIVQGKPWKFKTFLTLTATAVVVMFIDRFMPMLSDMLADTSYEGVTTNEIWSVDDGTNIIRVLVYAVPMLFALVGKQYVECENNPALNICVNCSIVTTALYAVSAVTSGVYIGRLPIYTSLMSYLLVPWLINHVFNRESAWVVKAIMIVLYLIFYCYQMFVAW